MDFDKELDDLRVKVADVQASVRAAANETHGRDPGPDRRGAGQAGQGGEDGQGAGRSGRRPGPGSVEESQGGRGGTDRKGEAQDRPSGRPVRRGQGRVGRRVGRERRGAGDRLRRLCRRERARCHPRRDRCQGERDAEGRSRPTGLTQQSHVDEWGDPPAAIGGCRCRARSAPPSAAARSPAAPSLRTPGRSRPRVRVTSRVAEPAGSRNRRGGELGSSTGGSAPLPLRPPRAADPIRSRRGFGWLRQPSARCAS